MNTENKAVETQENPWLLFKVLLIAAWIIFTFLGSVGGIIFLFTFKFNRWEL